MIRNEEFLQLREAYIEIGKMVQKYGYGQYNGILRILMGQVNCIDSDESDGEKMKYLIESYSKLFASRGGLSDFMIYDADVQLRNQLNEKYNDEVKRVWNIMKDYKSNGKLASNLVYWQLRNHQHRTVGDKKMHDNYIVGYNVDVEKKNIVIKMYNNTKEKQSEILFSEVLTHSFKCMIDYNIIFDIEEREISAFCIDNQEELKKLEGYCWPIDYQTEKELIAFLKNNGYKYIRVNSSYGMFGWILAKSYEIVE